MKRLLFLAFWLFASYVCDFNFILFFVCIQFICEHWEGVKYEVF